ncbi:hypothetical protein FYJ83_11605 [Tissierella sp. DSM 105185]|uniref:Uncharacterized protein n=1 Tax=Tissierella pigra TaxID=2607614 RepID=A0A6N7XKL4_9FIRM|nr:hypothetical protein [Tissierella pigra]
MKNLGMNSSGSVEVRELQENKTIKCTAYFKWGKEIWYEDEAENIISEKVRVKNPRKSLIDRIKSLPGDLKKAKEIFFYLIDISE